MRVSETGHRWEDNIFQSLVAGTGLKLLKLPQKAAEVQKDPNYESLHQLTVYKFPPLSRASLFTSLCLPVYFWAELITLALTATSSEQIPISDHFLEHSSCHHHDQWSALGSATFMRPQRKS